jgi:pimeloyl-ACP methyl ester carboxylesterase
MLVNHKIYGAENTKPIYILHGIFGMLDNWHNIANHLSNQFRVITFDARNHGKSFHNDDSSYVAMANDLKHLMECMHDQEAIIIGHSMGGKTALLFADMYPEMVKNLIAVDIAPKQYHPGHLEYFRAFRELDFSQIHSRKEAETAFLPFAPDMGVRQFLLKNLEADSAGGYKLKINLTAIENYYDEIIGAIDFKNAFTKSTHFILGEKSGYLKESDKPFIEQHFPTVSYHTVSKAGHWVHADNPAEFLSIINQIL